MTAGFTNGSGFLLQKGGSNVGVASVVNLIEGTNISFATSFSGSTASVTVSTSGSAGEANTASNAGLTGVGITLAKSGVNLPFKSITGDSMVNVADDVANSSVKLSITDGSLTYAKFQNVTGSRILGRYDSTAGVPEEISIGGGLSLTTAGVLQSNLPIVSKSGSYNLVAGDRASVLNAAVGGITFKLPSAATVGTGWWCIITNMTGSNITISANTGDHLFKNSVSQTSFTLADGCSCLWITNGGSSWYDLLTGMTDLANDVFGVLGMSSLPAQIKLGTVALTDGVSIATDASLGNTFAVTLGGNRTMSNPTNGTDGQTITYRISQDASGSRTITWGSAFRGSTDLALPTLTTTPSKTDYIGFKYNAASSTWDCIAVNKGF